MRKIAFIPARGGSKGIPNKNIKELCEKPLLYWVCNELEKSGQVDQIIIATDSLQIKYIVESFELPKLKVYDRKPENATDKSSTESVMLEYIEHNSFLKEDDIFILVQATNPFLQKYDIDNAINKYVNGVINYDSMLSVTVHNGFIWNEKGQSINHKHRKRRQELPREFKENGSFYINTVKNIKKYKNRLSGNIGLYEMPSYSGFEIDEPEDWDIVEFLMKKYIIRNKKQRNYPKKIKYFFTDCDGVLTDSGLYYDGDGNKLKKFNTKDGMGFYLLKKAGIKIGIITGDNTFDIRNRLERFKLEHIIMGSQYKLFDIQKLGLNLDETAYIGDDINDIELLKAVKYKACPNDAVEEVKQISGIKVLNNNGGQACVREFIDYLLSSF